MNNVNFVNARPEPTGTPVGVSVSADAVNGVVIVSVENQGSVGFSREDARHMAEKLVECSDALAAVGKRQVQ
jgi:hypothetical protein